MIGIYKITNTINNKCYIGSSVDIVGRWYHHKTTLKFNKHHSIKLQRSYNKYGADNFKYEVVEECVTELLFIREEYYINLFDCYNNGYNFSIPSNCVMLGRHHSEETKEILREKSKGNTNMLGKTHTEETKNRIRKKLKGVPLSDETKLKMSNFQKSRYHSEEEIKILTERNKTLVNKGRKQSPETIAKRVEKNTGKKRTEESKKKISDKLKGIVRGPMSDKEKLKRSKRIALISINNEIIKEYDSITKCATDLNIHIQRIGEILSGKRIHYKELYFKYI